MGKRCELCGAGEEAGPLVARCACYKKTEDFGLVHLECFAAMYDHAAHSDEMSDLPPPPTTCPRCKTKYRVTLDQRFASCCRVGVLRQMFDAVIVLMTFLCVCVTLYILDWHKMAEEGGQGGVILLGVLMVAAVISVFLTVQKAVEEGSK
eukprot:g311.t1